MNQPVPRHLRLLDGGRAPDQKADAIVTLTLAGEYDSGAEHVLAEQLAPAERYRAAVIDLTAVTYLESTSLEALLRLRNRIVQLRGTADLRLAGANPRLRRLFSVTGLDRIFTLYPTVEQASAAG